MKKLMLLTIFVSVMTANLNAGVISKAFQAWDQEQKKRPGLFPTPKERLEAGWAEKNFKFQIIKSELKSHMAQVIKSKSKSHIELPQELEETQIVLEKLDCYLDQKFENAQRWYMEILEQVQTGALKSHSDYQDYQKEKRTPDSVTLGATKKEVMKALSQVKKKRHLEYSPKDEAVQEAYRELCRKSFTIQYQKRLFNLKVDIENQWKNLTYSMVGPLCDSRDDKNKERKNTINSMVGREYRVTAEDWEKYEKLKKKAINDPTVSVIINSTSRWRVMQELENKQSEFENSCNEFLLSLLTKPVTSQSIEDDYKGHFPSLLRLLKRLKQTVMD